MSVLEQLLAVQEHDTAIDQLRHRLDHLPQRESLRQLDAASAELDRRRAESTTRRDELARVQKRLEDEIGLLDTKVTEVDRQLYSGNVTSPRELQALQDEIAALGRHKDGLEDQLLEVLTELEPVDETLAMIETESAGVAEERGGVEVQLLEAEESVSTELATVQAERADAVVGIPDERMVEYEGLRRQQGGIAVARLVGSSCGGCHLALSAVDIDRLRKLPPDEPGTCASAVASSCTDMFLWFLGVGFMAVVLVFKSPALDYRLVALGLLLPLVDVVPGVPPILHSLLGAVVLLAVTMLATRGRRLARRRWLGLPIGVFVHLVLDGAWTNTELFWWPAFGWSLPDVDVPTFGSGPAGVVLELLGIAALWWSWRQFRLDDPARRALLIHEGRLDRELVP